MRCKTQKRIRLHENNHRGYGWTTIIVEFAFSYYYLFMFFWSVSGMYKVLILRNKNNSQCIIWYHIIYIKSILFAVIYVDKQASETD